MPSGCPTAYSQRERAPPTTSAAGPDATHIHQTSSHAPPSTDSRRDVQPNGVARVVDRPYAAAGLGCAPWRTRENVSVGGTPDVANCPDLIITKVAVGPMDNNAYVLRCRATDEQLLIDAADEPERLLEVVGRDGLGRRSSPPTSTGTTGRRCPRSWRRHRRPHVRAAATTPPASPSPPTSWWTTATPSASAGSASTARHLVGHTPGSIALVYDDPDGHPARLHRRLPLPGRRRRQRGPGGLHVAHGRRRPRRSSASCPTRPGSTPATATTPPSAPSARTSPSGASAAGERPVPGGMGS